MTTPIEIDRDARIARLANEPLVPAGPTSGFLSGTAESIRGVWQYRELMDRLVRRELKSRYKDSALGFLWSLLRPLALLLVYYFAIGKFLGAADVTPDFAIFVFSGLTAWSLFADIVGSGSGSIVANGGLIKKIYLPREVFPLSVIGSALFNFGIQLMLLWVATFIAGNPPSFNNIVWVIAAVVILVVWGAAWAFLLSAVNVYLRDVQYLVEIALLVGFWSCPVVYSYKLVSGAAQGTLLLDLYPANPIALAVLCFQKGIWAAGAAEPRPDSLGLWAGGAIVVGLLFLWVCQRIFARLQANFAQEL